MVSALSQHGLQYHILTFWSHIFFTQISNSHKLHLTHTHYTLFTFTLTHEHMHIYTFTFSAVTHSPNHQRRTQHISSHRRHLGNIMATLGLRRPGEQVSTLTSGTCPPPEFPSNALRVTYTLNLLRGTFPWYGSTALCGNSVTFGTSYTLHIFTDFIT